MQGKDLDVTVIQHTESWGRAWSLESSERPCAGAHTRNRPLPMRATHLRVCLRNGLQSSPAPGALQRGAQLTTKCPDPAPTVWECHTPANSKHQRGGSAGWVLQLGLKVLSMP